MFYYSEKKIQYINTMFYVLKNFSNLQTNKTIFDKIKKDENKLHKLKNKIYHKGLNIKDGIYLLKTYMFYKCLNEEIEDSLKNTPETHLLFKAIFSYNFLINENIVFENRKENHYYITNILEHIIKNNNLHTLLDDKDIIEESYNVCNNLVLKERSI